MSLYFTATARHTSLNILLFCVDRNLRWYLCGNEPFNQAPGRDEGMSPIGATDHTIPLLVVLGDFVRDENAECQKGLREKRSHWEKNSKREKNQITKK